MKGAKQADANPSKRTQEKGPLSALIRIQRFDVESAEKAEWKFTEHNSSLPSDIFLVMENIKMYISFPDKKIIQILYKNCTKYRRISQ